MTDSPAVQLTLAGIRFTDDLARMRAFLEALGLSAGITRGQDWAAMHAEAGMVLLHSAATSDRGTPAGVTLITGESPDVAALAQALDRRGFRASVIDEAYGRSLEVVDPLGAIVTINETQRDTYGYVAHTPEPEPGVEVVLSRFTDPAGPYAGFCEALGLAPPASSASRDEHYAAYGAGRGVIGLHHDDGSTGLGGAGSVGADALVSLGFYTTWRLGQVQQRLTDAGFDPGKIVVADVDSRIETTDPDGQHVEIRRRPPDGQPPEAQASV